MRIPEQKAEALRAYRKTDKSRAAWARYMTTHGEARRIYSRARYAKNPEVAKKQLRAWQKNNPDKVARLNARRRALRASAPGKLTTADVAETRERDCGFCCYCLKPGATDLEHCTPLSRGGANTADNIVMACKACNSSKRTKIVLEFLTQWSKN